MRRAIARVLRAGPHELALCVPGWPGHRPGQFAMLQLDPEGHHRDPLLPRPMAIYRGSGEELEFRFKVVGRGTALLAELGSGAALGVVGPLGNGFDPPRGRPVLVGGGTGVASLYELARTAPPESLVALGGRTESEILGLDDFRALPLELRVATEDGSAGRRGLVTELLALEASDEVLACGPLGMMRRAHELARAVGARCQVSLETGMACGFGICLGCVVRTRQGYRYVCTHGPVFDADALDWEAAA
ncbi:MAG: dihydroorotate dehydrogenase electron transfer subunit [Myxococcota bacterium]